MDAAGLTGRERVASCDLCGGVGQRPFRTVSGRPIVRCASCGLLYVRERVTDEALNAVYAEAYYLERGMATDDPEAEKRANLERLEWLPKAPAGSRRMLDVGCGIGSFLADARDAGWEVHGTEVSTWGVGKAREHFGVEVVLGDLGDVGGRWAPASFDVVTCWHNIEHQRHPSRAIALMKELLKPGGRLVIRTPNAASFDQRWHGEAWVGWHDPGHFYFFGLSQMVRYCERTGLRVVHVDRGIARAVTGLRERFRSSPASSAGLYGSGSKPQPGGPSGRRGVKRLLVRAAGIVFSGRDMTLMAERP